MCVAYPGEIISSEGRTAKVDFGGNIVDVNTGLVDVRPGDWVLVHAGMATCTMSRDEAASLLELFNEIKEI